MNHGREDALEVVRGLTDGLGGRRDRGGRRRAGDELKVVLTAR
jgi:hypothetical protein